MVTIPCCREASDAGVLDLSGDYSGKGQAPPEGGTPNRVEIARFVKEVELMGFEPTTFRLPAERSPN